MKANKDQAYDIIGDIHGHADKLESLLSILGYTPEEHWFTHPHGRKALFLGDYIDRGPAIRRTLDIVRGMIDAGNALGILGNHEVNALCYHQNGEDGNPLRKHTDGNIKQHKATLEQVANIDPEYWEETLDWFRALPLWINIGNIRAVHAYWNDNDARRLDPVRSPQQGQSTIAELGRFLGEPRLSDNHLMRISQKNHDEYGQAVDRLLCGPELALSHNEFFETDDRKKRNSIRYRWWEDCAGKNYRQMVFPPVATEKISDAAITDCPTEGAYPDHAPLTFFGHYALPPGADPICLPNLACLDLGCGKGGELIAYSWDGEQTIDPTKFTELSPLGTSRI